LRGYKFSAIQRHDSLSLLFADTGVEVRSVHAGFGNQLDLSSGDPMICTAAVLHYPRGTGVEGKRKVLTLPCISSGLAHDGLHITVHIEGWFPVFVPDEAFPKKGALDSTLL
jgi:hypothetical protein